MKEVRRYKCHSSGECRAAGGRVFDIDDPLPRQLYAKIVAGGRDDSRIAVPAALDSLPTHSFYVRTGFTF